ncbi:hypothetical protein CDCA_CDCA03G1055 [Cyanidium caldarium]|uniref:Coenzyme Q-binding protein COQ10 START domain-containing protein n=1 Tax=Cyanidium caldarium TaxID=2771 RepID=A0AAV9ISG4_CYACA|nr:hypothetical protein CDCA_CDCA03G1055 [Cyanidium caldarium]
MLWNGSWRQVVQKWRTSAWPSGTWLGDDGAEQGRTEEVALDDGETSLRASERLLVRLRTHDGRYLAVQASSAEATATTPPLEVVSRRRARHNAASTIFILRKSPPGHHDAPSWAWSDRLSRPLHLLVPGGAAPPRLVVLAEPADDAHLQLELEQAAVDAVRRPYVALRVASRYVSAPPRTSRVEPTRLRVQRWERFLLELLPTERLERPLPLRLAFGAFIRIDVPSVWPHPPRCLGWAVAPTGRLVATPASVPADHLVPRPCPFLFEYDDVTRTVVVRDPLGRYVHATEDGGTHLVAHTTWRPSAEHFTVHAYGGNRLALETRWGWVTADASGGEGGGGGRSAWIPLRSNRHRARAWERFRLVPVLFRGTLDAWWREALLRAPDAERAAAEKPADAAPAAVDAEHVDCVIEMRQGTRRHVRATATAPHISSAGAFEAITDYAGYERFCRGVAASRIVECHDSEQGRVTLMRTVQTRSLWIFSIRVEMLLRAEERPKAGQVCFSMVSGSGAKKYAAQWDITALAADDPAAGCHLSLFIDFQPVVYIPKKWLDGIAINAARDALLDMLRECTLRRARQAAAPSR